MGMAVIQIETVEDVLVAARKMIEDPKAWAQGDYMRFPYHGTVPSFCALGAVRYAGFHDESILFQTRRALWDVLPSFYRREYSGMISGIAAFNDAPHRTHKEVLDLFDKAISAVRAAA